MKARAPTILVSALVILASLLLMAAQPDKPEKIKIGPIGTDHANGLLTVSVPIQVRWSFTRGGSAAPASSPSVGWTVQTVVEVTDESGNDVCDEGRYLTPLSATPRARGNTYVDVGTVVHTCNFTGTPQTSTILVEARLFNHNGKPTAASNDSIWIDLGYPVPIGGER